MDPLDRLGQRARGRDASAGASLKIRLRGGIGPGGGTGGRILGTIFFLFFLAMGSVLFTFAVRGAWRTIRTYGWERTTCRILSSTVQREPQSGDYEFQPRYSYEAGGRTREGTVYKPGYAGSSQASEAEALSSRYPKDAEVPCWVSGDDPAKAALERPSLWTILIVLFPLAFVAVGAGGLFMVWSSKTTSAEDPSRRAISRKAGSPLQAAGCLAAFFGVFLVFGLGFSLFFVLPALKVWKSRAWREVPCTVVESRVRTHSDSDGNTYSVDILYEYEAGGRTRRSNRYEFLGGSSGGSGAKEAIVAANPPGTRRSCFVNPDDPDDVVMHRELSKTYAVAFVPLLFAAVGFGGIVWALRMRRGGARAPGDAASFGARSASAAGAAGFGPVKLATPHPIAKLFGVIVLALFWNGIVSVFFWKMLQEWKGGQKPFFLTCFLVPFVLVGLVLIFGVFYNLLAAFNPRPSLSLSSPAIPLGGSATLSWSFSGSVSRLRGLRVVLEGTEEARYRRGTTTYTDRETFATIPIYESPGGAAPSGSASVSIPKGAMHSFTAPNNRIVWTLKLSGEIPNWPDVTESVELEVTPS